MLGNTGFLPSAWRPSTTRCSGRGHPHMPLFYNSTESFAPIRSPRLCRLPASGAHVQSRTWDPRLSRFPSPCNATLFWLSEKSVCIISPGITDRNLITVADLLYMHRGFFAHVLNTYPKDPLGSPYGSSVIAAYRSAVSLIGLMQNLHSQLREPMERMWFLWTHMFSCAVCLRVGINLVIGH